MGMKILKAFIFGGCIAVAAHIFIMLASLMIPDPMLATIIALFAFGILSAVFIAVGLYDRISKFADFGADQPLSGLMYGAAGIAENMKAGHASAGKAFLKGFITVMIIVGIGFVISAILGFFLGA